jgi:16S rRNA G966 N2-methylase RsmD
MTGVNVLQMDVFKYMESCSQQYDLIFAGPPYPLPNLPEIPDLIFKHNLVEGEGWFIMEHNPNHNFEQHPHFYKYKNYGTTIFAIFRNQGKKEVDDTVI